MFSLLLMEKSHSFTLEFHPVCIAVCSPLYFSSEFLCSPFPLWLLTGALKIILILLWMEEGHSFASEVHGRGQISGTELAALNLLFYVIPPLWRSCLLSDQQISLETRVLLCLHEYFIFLQILSLMELNYLTFERGKSAPQVTEPVSCTPFLA